ncbi:hypothetical protein BST92_04075 [Nonlabens arenilitoris]|uniref:Carboxypeptidase n=1 Tax=Nonlabens arenilitoris TaxID=1217969 RepID=A0A2S7U950_9FLAO|nr:DUF5686 family protein [Nonlabens arenilitoris]PQJ31150.1 hypothetical protein BST92_04075 [Nonlabens arenilitoris]
MRYWPFILFLFSSIIVQAQQDVTPALEIIKASIANKDLNNPLKALNTFQYESYENLKIAGNPEAITGSGYKKTELRRTLLKTGVFLSEKTSDIVHDQSQGYKELITAAFMPGFDKPVYPIYNINFQSRNLYQDTYVVFDQHYINPVSNSGLNSYNYETIGDTIIENRKINIIGFAPIETSTSTLSGTIYIDQETSAIAKAHYNIFKNLRVETKHDYVYDSLHHLWYCSYSELFIKKTNNVKEIELFGGRFEVGTRKQEDIDRETDELYLIMKRYQKDFKTNRKVTFGQKGVSIEIPENSIDKPLSYWDTYRNEEPFTTQELANFMQLDSIVMAEKVTRKLEVIEKFKVGYYPVGFFDIDLKYLIKFNEYEAFRIGIGGTTNDKFSERWRVSGYGAFGTKDKVFKHNITLGYRISEENNTWLSAYKTDDINEFAGARFLTDARVYSLFEPRLINIPTFYLYKEYGVSLQQRLFPSVISEFSLSRKRISQTTNYVFAPDGNPFVNYVLSEATIAARWSPKSEFMKTPKGYQETIKGYPILSGQVTKGIQGLLDSDFNYLKFSGKASYTIHRINGSKTAFLLEGHYASGDVPLSHLFHAYPNSPTKDEVLQRFSVAGRNSFETMYFNEFFSDRIATLQMRHNFAPFHITSWLNPELVITSRYAIGDFNDTGDHLNIDFNRLNKGYTESGFELNKLIYGFGISATYRYGAYHLPQFSDNLALKFTFYLEI